MPFGLPEKTSLDYQKVFKSVVPLGQTDGLEKKEKTTEEAGHFKITSIMVPDLVFVPRLCT